MCRVNCSQSLCSLFVRLEKCDFSSPPLVPTPRPKSTANTIHKFVLAPIDSFPSFLSPSSVYHLTPPAAASSLCLTLVAIARLRVVAPSLIFWSAWAFPPCPFLSRHSRRFRLSDDPKISRWFVVSWSQISIHANSVTYVSCHFIS